MKWGTKKSMDPPPSMLPGLATVSIGSLPPRSVGVGRGAAALLGVGLACRYGLGAATVWAIKAGRRTQVLHSHCLSLRAIGVRNAEGSGTCRRHDPLQRWQYVQWQITRLENTLAETAKQMI